MTDFEMSERQGIKSYIKMGEEEDKEKLSGFLLVFALLLVELSLLFGGGVLILLVFRDQIVHVGLGFGELHLVHALTGVPRGRNGETSMSPRIGGRKRAGSGRRSESRTMRGME